MHDAREPRPARDRSGARSLVACARAALAAAAVLGAAACSGGGSSGGSGGSAGAPAQGGLPAPPAPPQAIPGTTLLMDYAAAASGGARFYDAPFPDESRRKPGGTIDLDRFPNRGTNLFIDAMLAVAERDNDGFGLTSAIYFRASGPLGTAALPSLADTVDPRAAAFVIGADPGSPDYLVRQPVEVELHADAGPSGAPDLLSLLPLQGAPLREGTLYAAVVLRRLGDAQGAPLGVSLPMAQLAARVQPAGMPAAAFVDALVALDALEQDGTDLAEVAGLAVLRTGRPTAGLERVCQAVLARPLPQPLAPFVLDELFADYAVLRSTIRMPVYQDGQPPFLFVGGGWVFDASGAPVLQTEEEANLYVTIPRRPMPPGGFPAVVFVRTGFGQGPRPLVDRVKAPSGAPGTGPAFELAQAGYMGVQVDGPHGGRRNVAALDEQLLMFNVSNPVAMRDNVRQSAIELALLAEVLGTLAFDPALVPGATAPSGGPLRIDPGTLALFGHSMGATIAPLVLAVQPRFRAAVLSGCGGSWIENVMFKENPFPIRPVAELILGYPALSRGLYRHDPALQLLQWAGEAADPPIYARYATREPRLGSPRHILMVQGIVDSYIFPSIANPMSLAFGLDLAGPALDWTMPRLPWTTPLDEVSAFGGNLRVGLPVSGNRFAAGLGPHTAVVVQHPGDGVQNGHEVAFQVDAARAQWRTFLETLAAGGAPTVP